MVRRIGFVVAVLAVVWVALARSCADGPETTDPPPGAASAVPAGAAVPATEPPRIRRAGRFASPDTPEEATPEAPAAGAPDVAPPPGIHRFRVVDPEGLPVARVRLIVTWGGPAGDVADTTTVDGEARLPSSADVGRIDARPVETGDPPLLARTGIAPPPGARDHRIVLARGAWLRTRALLPDGSPLSGAGLLVRGADGFEARIRCDESGRARTEVPADGTFDVTVEGHAVLVSEGKVRQVTVPWDGTLHGARPGEEVSIPLRPLESAPLGVRVTTPDGTPAPGVRVKIRLPRHGMPVDEADTDSAGLARSRDLPRRRYEVEVLLPAEGPLRDAYVPPPVVGAVPGDARVDVTLLPARSIRGVVVDSDGRPLPRARVAILRGAEEIASTASGDDGGFALAVPEAVTGPVSVTATAWVQGRAPLEGTTSGVAAGADSVRVVASPAK